jgi:hypothetical protein
LLKLFQALHITGRIINIKVYRGMRDKVFIKRNYTGGRVYIMRVNIDDIAFRLFLWSEQSKVKRELNVKLIRSLLNHLELNEAELNYLATKLK